MDTKPVSTGVLLYTTAHACTDQRRRADARCAAWIAYECCRRIWSLLIERGVQLGMRLKYSRAIALLAATATACGSIIFLFLTAGMKPGIPTTALVNILSVLLSLGIVAILYDLFLRGSVLHETLEMIGIKESITNIGLRYISQSEPPDWKALCSGAQTIAILLINPLGWVENEWKYVLSAAKGRSVDVSIYIPRADGEHIELLASRLGFPPAEFIPLLKSAKNFLETSWRGEEDKSIKKGSKFTLRTYQGIAGYEVGLFDDRAIIIVSDPLARHFPAQTLMLEFAGTRARPVHDWLQGQLTDLDISPTVEFSSEVS